MNKTINKKYIFIFLSIVILLACCTAVICSVSLYAIKNLALKSGKEIREAVLAEACESHGIMTEAEYEMWFHEAYRDSKPYAIAIVELSQAFPKNFDCKLILNGNLMDMVRTNQSFTINSSSSLDSVSAEVKYDNGVASYIIYLNDPNADGNWQILRISEV